MSSKFINLSRALLVKVNGHIVLDVHPIAFGDLFDVRVLVKVYGRHWFVQFELAQVLDQEDGEGRVRVQHRDQLLVYIEIYLLSIVESDLLRLVIEVIVNLCFVFSYLGCGETLSAMEVVIDTIIKLLLGETA